MYEMKYQTRVIEGRNATAVAIRYGTYVGTGVAKREPGDLRNPFIGIALASARAFNDLAIQLEEAALTRVREGAQRAEAEELAQAKAKAESVIKLPVEKPLLPIKEIKKMYGKEAARRAQERRAARSHK